MVVVTEKMLEVEACKIKICYEDIKMQCTRNNIRNIAIKKPRGYVHIRRSEGGGPKFVSEICVKSDPKICVVVLETKGNIFKVT